MTDENSDRPDGSDQRKVGYKNPPVDTRYRKGVSGNPAGRPKGARNRGTILKDVLFGRHWVTVGGKRVRRTALELVLLAFRNKMLSGDVRAFREYLKLLDKYGPKPPGKRGGFLVVPESMPTEMWMERYGIRGSDDSQQ